MRLSLLILMLMMFLQNMLYMIDKDFRAYFNKLVIVKLM